MNSGAIGNLDMSSLDKVISLDAEKEVGNVFEMDAVGSGDISGSDFPLEDRSGDGDGHIAEMDSGDDTSVADGGDDATGTVEDVFELSCDGRGTDGGDTGPYTDCMDATTGSVDTDAMAGSVDSDRSDR